jgi:hypothetical protein
MSITNVTTQSLIASLGYLDPTATDSTDASSSDPLLAASQAATPYSSSSSSSSTSTSSSATSISQVGYILSSLSSLNKQDPAGFKQNAAAISKDFRSAASECSNTLQRFSLESMADQFSNASISGSMSSINLASTSNTMVKAYAGQSSLSLLDCMTGSSSQGSDFSSQVTSILNQNLSNVMPNLSS